MTALLTVQFILGVLLVVIISRRCPPERFSERFLNLLCAVPGSLAATGAIVYSEELGWLSSSCISMVLLLIILIKIKISDFSLCNQSVVKTQ